MGGRLLAAVVVLAAAEAARAQPPADPYSPAYRLFLSSPSPYKTYMATTPASGFQQFTPFGAQGYFVEPGYVEQRISRRGFEAYSLVPGRGGYADSPFGFAGWYSPGYELYFHGPLPPLGR